MQINITVEDPSGGAEKTGPVTVGWMLTQDRAGILFDAPARLRSPEMDKSHAKSASRCPAVLNLEARYFEVKCPFDLNIGFARDKEGVARLRNLAGDAGAVRANKLAEILHLVPEVEWRYPGRPTVQIKLPYLFVADEPVYMTQVSPFLHYRPDPLPGTIFAGRFPIHVWPRPLAWAFEWHDVDKPLVLRRGEPLFYAQFETLPQDRSVQLVEAERTPEFDSYLDQISSVVNYVNQTFSLFKAAEERRPEKLVVPVKRRG